MSFYLHQYVENQNFLWWSCRYPSQGQWHVVGIRQEFDRDTLWAMAMDRLCTRIGKGIERAVYCRQRSRAEQQMAGIAVYAHNTPQCACKGICGNGLRMKWEGKYSIFGERRSCGEFWWAYRLYSVGWLWSYEGFDLLDIRWNGWVVMTVIEVHAVFRRVLAPKLLLKTAAV